MSMRLRLWLPLCLALAACSNSAGTSKLTLRNMVWDHVNVEVAVMRGGSCETQGPDFIRSQVFHMQMDQTKTITAPDESTICWRHDRYPTNPHPGEWSGWSRAILFPGNDSTTDL
jgi:hypothetical protein